MNSTQAIDAFLDNIDKLEALMNNAPIGLTPADIKLREAAVSGGSVLLVASFEGYITSAIQELAQYLTALRLTASELPEPILRTNVFHAKNVFADGSNSAPFWKSQYYTVDDKVVLSPEAFAHRIMNPNPERVQGILLGFGIDGPWEKVFVQVKASGTSIAVGLSDSSALMKYVDNVVENRHVHAHGGVGSTTLTDLRQYTDVLLDVVGATDKVLVDHVNRIQITAEGGQIGFKELYAKISGGFEWVYGLVDAKEVAIPGTRPLLPFVARKAPGTKRFLRSGFAVGNAIADLHKCWDSIERALSHLPVDELRRKVIVSV